MQNVMWLAFCVAAGELVVRHSTGRREGEQIYLGLLPEDGETILRKRTVLGIAFAMRSAGVMFAGAGIMDGTIGPEMMEQL